MVAIAVMTCIFTFGAASHSELGFVESTNRTSFLMRITHNINDFLYTLFSTVTPGNQQELLNAFRAYYTYGPFKPNIAIVGAALGRGLEAGRQL